MVVLRSAWSVVYMRARFLKADRISELARSLAAEIESQDPGFSSSKEVDTIGMSRARDMLLALRYVPQPP